MDSFSFYDAVMMGSGVLAGASFVALIWVVVAHYPWQRQPDAD